MIFCLTYIGTVLIVVTLLSCFVSSRPYICPKCHAKIRKLPDLKTHICRPSARSLIENSLIHPFNPALHPRERQR